MTPHLSFPAAVKWLGAAVISVWAGIPGTIQLLVLLMLIDQVSGLAAGYVTKQLSSDAGLRGLVKKSMVLVVLLVAFVVERNMNADFGAVRIGAVGYCINEIISIIENVYRCGVPIPSQLVAALMNAKKLRMREATPEELAELGKPVIKPVEETPHA